MLKELINSTYYLEILLLNQGGRQLAANVYKFLEIAQITRPGQGLGDFIDYIEKLKDTDESQAKIEPKMQM